MVSRDHQAAGGELEKQAGDHGAEQLRDPVQNAPKQRDVATEEGAEGDGRVDVAAGDVGPDGYCDVEAEAMGQGRRHQPRWGCGAIIRELICQNNSPRSTSLVLLTRHAHSAGKDGAY